MPYNVAEKYPEVIRKLREQGYRSQATVRNLQVVFAQVLGVIKPGTVKNNIIAMENLGFLKNSGVPGVWTITSPSKPGETKAPEDMTLEDDEKATAKLIEEKSRPEKGVKHD